MSPINVEQQQAIQRLTEALRSPAFRPPMLPRVAEEAMRLARQANTGMQAMATLIERDQVLAARFLSVANSSIYRRSLPATTVQTALTRIGVDSARDILIYASLEPFLFTCSRFAKEMEALRRHSLAVSAAAGHLARLQRMPASDASLAGLIHDIGAAALLKHISDNATQLAALYATPTGVADAVAQLHALAGDRVCLLWSLPPTVKAVAGSHHSVTNTSAPLVQLAAAADELATRSGAGSPLDFRETRVLEAYLSQPMLVKKTVGDFSERLASL